MFESPKSTAPSISASPNLYNLAQQHRQQTHSSSTPLANLHSSSPNNNRSNSSQFKSQTYKQFNHSKLRQNAYPYTTATQQQQQQHQQKHQQQRHHIQNGGGGGGFNLNFQHQPTGVSAHRDLEICYSDFTSSSETTSSKSGHQILQLSWSNNSESAANTSIQSDLVNVSLRTNPPTTPGSMSDTSNNNTASSPSSSGMLCHLLKRQDLRSAASSSSTSTSNNNKVKSQPLYATPATSTSPGSSSSAKFSSMQTNFSRASSITSLSSFADQIKAAGAGSSGDSEAPSEYTSGFMTPACYSELPDSPGDPNHAFISNYRAQQEHLQQQRALANSMRFMQQQHQQQLHPATTLDDLSYITVDSSASKSNDITVIERTMLQSNLFNHQVLRSANSSSESSQSNSFLAMHHPTLVAAVNNHKHMQYVAAETEEEDDGSVRKYGEMSDECDTRSVHSNISALSFPNEPPVEFSRFQSLLASASSNKTKINNETKQQQSSRPMPLMAKLEGSSGEVYKQTPQVWSTYTIPTNPVMFTPPVKLNNNPNDVVSYSHVTSNAGGFNFNNGFNNFNPFQVNFRRNLFFFVFILF